jgi:hypothetical protein
MAWLYTLRRPIIIHPEKIWAKKPTFDGMKEKKHPII